MAVRTAVNKRRVEDYFDMGLNGQSPDARIFEWGLI